MFGTFCQPFADPSHKLRASAQGFGLGLRLKATSEGTKATEESHKFF